MKWHDKTTTRNNIYPRITCRCSIRRTRFWKRSRWQKKASVSSSTTQSNTKTSHNSLTQYTPHLLSTMEMSIYLSYPDMKPSMKGFRCGSTCLLIMKPDQVDLPKLFHCTPYQLSIYIWLFFPRLPRNYAQDCGSQSCYVYILLLTWIPNVGKWQGKKQPQNAVAKEYKISVYQEQTSLNNSHAFFGAYV